MRAYFSFLYKLVLLCSRLTLGLQLLCQQKLFFFVMLILKAFLLKINWNIYLAEMVSTSSIGFGNSKFCYFLLKSLIWIKKFLRRF